MGNTVGVREWQIRDAKDDEAAAICDLLRRSISELCHADHGGDPERVGRWLANKTPAQVTAWIRDPGTHLLVAAEGGRILAVGSVVAAGRIGLNYVAPEARFRGASRAMLRALEARAASLGADRCTLESTETALQFYRTAGYRPEGPSTHVFGLVAHPMSRRVARRQ